MGPTSRAPPDGVPRDVQVLRIHIGTHNKIGGGTKNLKTGEKELDVDMEESANAERTLSRAELDLMRTFTTRGWRPRWLIGQTPGNCDHVAERRSNAALGSVASAVLSLIHI